jgi:hypothetical protein
MLAAALYNRFTTTMLTVQEFPALAESDEQRRELIGGEVVCTGAGHIPHEVVKKNLTKIRCQASSQRNRRTLSRIVLSAR